MDQAFLYRVHSSFARYLPEDTTYFSAFRSLSCPLERTAMLQSTHRANPSRSNNSAILPAWRMYNVINQQLHSTNVSYTFVLLDWATCSFMSFSFSFLLVALFLLKGNSYTLCTPIYIICCLSSLPKLIWHTLHFVNFRKKHMQSYSGDISRYFTLVNINIRNSKVHVL